MSMMLCADCGRLVNCDDDPESLYVVEDKCICVGCRENYPSLDDHLKACAGIMPNQGSKRAKRKQTRASVTFEQVYDAAFQVITEHVRETSWPSPILPEFEVRQLAGCIASRLVVRP